MYGMLSRARSLWRALRQRSDLGAEMEEEFTFHIERRATDLVAAGYTRDEARRRAIVEFGSAARYREEGRESRGLRFFDHLRRDVRYATRSLRKRPTFTLAAVVTLALGVGGTAAVYAITRALLFADLPYQHEDEVGVFWKKTDWTEEEFLYMRGRTPGFREVALYRSADVILRHDEAPARLLAGVRASSELFDVLGAQPLHGRTLRAGDDVEGAESVALLSHALWQELGADPAIVGTRLTLNGAPHTVIGVMPRGFWFPDPTVRIWTAERLSPTTRNWNSTLIGRVDAGHDVRALSAPVAQLTAMLDERFDYPAQWDKTVGAQITPVRDDIIGHMRPALYATLAAMALILLIACANVAALMLGQVDARSADLALRLALGASRRLLTQQLVVEAMLIALVAGFLGAVFAWGSFPALTRALPLGAWADGTAPDVTVFAAAMAIAVLSSLLVVIVPALSLRGRSLRMTLGTVRTGGVDGRRGRMEHALVVAEVAFAVLIACGAALLTRSVANLYALDPGVRTQHVGIIDVTLSGGNLARQQQTVRELTAALAELPGVRSAGLAQTLPLRGGGYNLPLTIDGHPDVDGVTTEFRIVTPGYLETMGITLRDGRSITHADGIDSEPVVVINETLADRHFPGVNPVGQRIGDNINGRRTRIIGVVADAAERQLTDDDVPVRYVALAQLPWIDPTQSLVFRAAPGADAGALLDAARRTVQSVAPGAAVRTTTTMSRVLEEAIGPARQVMSLLSLITALALTLGAVGIYGVIAQFAARGRRDCAIRIALGLPGSRAAAHVIARAALLVGAGIAVGVAGAAALARLLSSFLYGVNATDPLAFAAAAATLLGVGLIAAFVPAWRAGRTDPAMVLREP